MTSIPSREKRLRHMELKDLDAESNSNRLMMK